MLRRLNQFLAGQPTGVLLAIGGLLLALIGGLDYVTGLELQFGFFYLLPVAGAAWFAGPRPGVVLAGLAALVWAAVNWPAGAAVGPQLWNALAQLGLCLLAAVLVAGLRRQARRLEQAAAHDALTGLANRRAFEQVAGLAGSRCQRFGSPFTIVYLDIDNFKAVNAAQGQAMGDAFLCQMAVVIRQNIRNIDTVGRLGGDEFGILLPDAGALGVRPAVERIQQRLLRTVSATRRAISFSIGVVTFSRPAASTAQMFTIVDAALRTAKRGGSNSLVFEVWPAPASDPETRP
jgi:diguanylate cyclase (GGDEF)-like protein